MCTRTNNKVWLLALILILTNSIYAQKTNNNMQKHIELTQQWDKTFPKSDKVNHKKVIFHNRFGIELVADMYTPQDAKGKLPAIAVSGPYSAVKEQVSGRYAQHMAEEGFLAIAFDPSYYGESGGYPRDITSPSLSTEDFMAAVDFLSVQDNVNADHIGVIGICGWGGMALAAASIDPRIKATATVTMYDMTRVIANGYFDADNSSEKRDSMRKALAAQRTQDYKNGTYALAGGNPDPAALPANAPQYLKDYVDYYKVRAYHKRSLGSNGGFTVTSAQSYLNFPLLTYASEIKTPVLMIHGEKAHSLYFSKTAYAKLTGNNKELYIVEGACHTDLYDNEKMIPWQKITDFFTANLK